MAKKTVKKPARKVNARVARAAAATARKVSKKAASRRPAKLGAGGKVKAAIRKPMLQVKRAKLTLASKAKSLAHDAGMAAATAVGAALGATEAVKDLVKGK